MTEVPPSDDGRSSADETDPSGAASSVPPFLPAAYPPPFGSDAAVSDDDLAAALAAQTAMYTGPITIPVINSDPVFRPDPAELQQDVPPPADDAVPETILLPPVPVPPPPAPVEYVAPDGIAADPEPPAFETAEPVAVPLDEPQVVDSWGPPVETAAFAAPGAVGDDDELSRTVESEAAAGSTLDAILLLENELRRRQGLPPVDPADEPPAGIDAAYGAVPLLIADPADPADPEAFAAPVAAPPGWTPAPDPENEGLIPDPSEQAWLTAPPPSFTPPPLVEPPAPEDPLDAPAFIPPPAEPVGDADAIDPVLLPPPAGPPVSSPDLAAAPPPVVAATPLTPPPFEALVVGAAIADPEVEGIDDLDRADLVAPIPVDETGVAEVAPAPVVAAAAGAAVIPPAGDELPVADPEPFVVERTSIEPTPAERRAGHAARMFWLWFAANSSFVMVAVGATLFGLGMSLRQTLVAVVAGVALSALPLGLGTLAGKWSGQPTMTVSRATFGLVGNIVPVVLAILGRALWGGVMLWLLAVSTASILGGSGTSSGLTVSAIVALAVGAVLAAVVAVVGFGLLYRVQRVLGILSILLLAITILMTAGHVDIAAALTTGDGSWVLAIGGAVVVFSVVGLAWAQSSSDLARYQRAGGSGAANMLWGTFGVIVPTLLILSWGALLAASDAAFADELARQPLTAIASIVPGWFSLPLLAVTAFGLLSGAILTVYSGGLAVASTGLRASRPLATLVAAVLVAVVGFALLAVGADTRSVVRDLATTLAVPVAAWAGIFASEMMIRLRRFHAPSLLSPGGVYPAVRWVNLVGLIVITVVGLGFTTAQMAGLDWQGYLFRAFGTAADDPWAASDVGVLLALLLGVLLPLVAGIPAIRRQERPLEATTGGMPAVDALVD
jgi:purine-cytosine permease-like protein